MNKLRYPRIGVSAVISDNDGRVLNMWHIKHEKWALPVGKVDEGETPEEALIREMKEELGIDIIEFREIVRKTVVYTGDGNKPDETVELILCMVDEYAGIPDNMEPTKHRRLEWNTFDDFRRGVWNSKPMTDTLKMYIDWVNGGDDPEDID